MGNLQVLQKKHKTVMDACHETDLALYANKCNLEQYNQAILIKDHFSRLKRVAFKGLGKSMLLTTGAILLYKSQLGPIFLPNIEIVERLSTTMIVTVFAIESLAELASYLEDKKKYKTFGKRFEDLSLEKLKEEVKKLEEKERTLELELQKNKTILNYLKDEIEHEKNKIGKMIPQRELPTLEDLKKIDYATVHLREYKIPKVKIKRRDEKMLQKPKGTYDVNGEMGRTILYIENLFRALMEKYNYEYVRTPIFESSELFHRGVGESSDIVSKETYDFKDRGDRNMTLRPEGTAGVVRSFIENKLYARDTKPIKNWYYGPMYRYERPQSGRFREFYQFGVEVFGTDNPLMDAEVISIPVNLYKMLGLKGIKVNINTLGDKESRENYRNALKEHFRPHLDSLCEDCKVRFEKNPLRILDCKVDKDLEVMKNAPKTIDYLNEESKEHFELVKKYLDALNIEYVVNPSVVRGLDYYTHTVFEVEAKIEGFGAQNVLCGGGRYNTLVEQVGGPSTPGVGFALGMERLLNALEFENIKVNEQSLDVYIIPFLETKEYCASLTQLVRLNGFTCDMDYLEKSVKANFKQADRMNAKYVILVGDTEVKEKVLTIKDNETKEEYKIKEEDFIQFLDENIESEHE